MLTTMRAALATFDLAELAWAAEGFAAHDCVRDDRRTLLALLDRVELAAPGDLDAALKVCAGQGPFECFAFACLARHAGIGKDLVHEGAMTALPSAVAGDLIVRGPLVCTSENWLLVAGNVRADLLVTSADVIIGGDATFRDGVIGINTWVQSMWVRGAVHAPHLIVEDYSVELGDGPDPCELADDRVDSLLAAGLADEIRAWSNGCGPDDAVTRIADRMLRGGPVFARR